MGKYYEAVSIPSKTPVQYVGVYVLRWGEEDQPEVGFFESPVGRHKEQWRGIAYELRRQLDEALKERDAAWTLIDANLNIQSKANRLLREEAE